MSSVNVPRLKSMLLALAFICIFCCFSRNYPHSQSLIVSTSLNPIHLQLRRQNSTSNVIKTKPELFEKVLGLKSGNPFQFQLLKWRKLQQSGLFKELKAKTFLFNDTSSNSSEKVVARIEITGIELPSVIISPEITLTSSRESPSFSGGLVYSDRNFRGLGETLEICLAKKGDSADISTSKSFKWKQCDIGSTTHASINFDEHGSFVLIDNFFRPTGHIKHNSNRSPSFVGTVISKLQFNFQRLLSGPNEIYESVYKDVVQSSPYSFLLSNSPSISYIKGFKELRESEYNYPAFDYLEAGCKNSISWFHQLGCSMTGWFEHGYLHSKFLVDDVVSDDTRSHGRFQTIGLSTQLPPYQMILKNKKIPNTNETLSYFLDGSTRIKFERSWGDGCLPFLRYKSIGGSSIFRGLNLPRYNGLNHANVHGVIKTDIKFGSTTSMIPLITPGVFLDSGFYENVHSMKNHVANDQQFNYATTFGFSFRFSGFKVEMGWKANFNNLFANPYHPHVHFGFDSD